MKMRDFQWLSVSALLALPLRAFAQCPNGGNCLPILIGTRLTIPEIAQRVIVFLTTTITTVSSVLFLVGAFMIVLSGVKEDYKQKGKDIMIGSVISMCVVLGAYSIWRMVMYFLNIA